MSGTETSDADAVESWSVRNSQRLLDVLCDAVQRRDGRSIYCFCKTNAPLVIRSFKSWLGRAQDLADDGPRYHAYLNALYIIAKTMSDSVRRGCLFAVLVDAAESNTFAMWERKLEEAHALMGQLRLDAAASLLSDHLIDVRNLPGYGYRHMTATTHWYIAQAHINARRRDDAVAHAERSLSITREINDHPSYHRRYLKYLMEVHQYFGEGQRAARWAGELADFYEEFNAPRDARWHRSLARVMLQGEPPVRVVATLGEETYEMDDLPYSSKIEFSLHALRNRRRLLPSRVLAQRAGELIGQGRHEQAMEALAAAAEADPFDPEPLEDLGNLQMAAATFVEAAASYEKVEELAPGWSDCRTKLWLARGVLNGELDEQLVETVWDLWADDAKPAEMLQALRRAAKRHPRVGLLHRELAEALVAAGRQADAARAYRAGLGCDTDRQLRTQLLFGAAQTAQAGSREQKRFIEEAAQLNGDLITGAMARLLVRFGFPELP